MTTNKILKNVDISEDLAAAFENARSNLLMFAGVLIGLNACASDFESAAVMFASIDKEEIIELVQEILTRTAK